MQSIGMYVKHYIVSCSKMFHRVLVIHQKFSRFEQPSVSVQRPWSQVSGLSVSPIVLAFFTYGHSESGNFNLVMSSDLIPFRRVYFFCVQSADGQKSFPQILIGLPNLKMSNLSSDWLFFYVYLSADWLILFFELYEIYILWWPLNESQLVPFWLLNQSTWNTFEDVTYSSVQFEVAINGLYRWLTGVQLHQVVQYSEGVE